MSVALVEVPDNYGSLSVDERGTSDVAQSGPSGRQTHRDQRYWKSLVVGLLEPGVVLVEAGRGAGLQLVGEHDDRTRGVTHNNAERLVVQGSLVSERGWQVVVGVTPSASTSHPDFLARNRSGSACSTQIA